MRTGKAIVSSCGGAPYGDVAVVSRLPAQMLSHNKGQLDCLGGLSCFGAKGKVLSPNDFKRLNTLLNTAFKIFCAPLADVSVS